VFIRKVSVFLHATFHTQTVVFNAKNIAKPQSSDFSSKSFKKKKLKIIVVYYIQTRTENRHKI
jgi:hypothetical protein